MSRSTRSVNSRRTTVAFLKGKLTDIEAQIDELARVAQAFRVVIGVIEQDAGAEPEADKLSLRDAIWDVLNEAGEPLHYRKVYERLRQRGVDVPGLQPLKNVGAHMSLDDRFTSVGAGMWTVKP